MDESPYTYDRGLASWSECHRQGLVSDAELIDYEDLLCHMHIHRLAWERLKKIRKRRGKYAAKLVKAWTLKNIPDGGFIINDARFYAASVQVRKKSIKDLGGHIADARYKLLVMQINEILRECECIQNVPLKNISHGLKKRKIEELSGLPITHLRCGVICTRRTWKTEHKKLGHHTP